MSSHSGALAVPAREAVAPGRWPAHDVLGLCLLPQGEVGLVALLAHPVEFAAGILHVVEVASAQSAIVVVAVIFLHVEIDAAVALVGISGIENLLHELFLLDDVPGGVRLDAGRQHAQRLHGGMVAIGIVLRHFHGLELLEARLLGNLVLALVGIVLEVPHVGDVAHIAHLVAQLLQMAEKHVEGDGGTRVTQVRIAIDGGAAHIHAHMGRRQRHKQLLAPRERVIEVKWCHCSVEWLVR